MRRIGVRLSVRTLLELVALAGLGLAAWRLAEESRPPGPEVRALRGGDEAERVAALRSLSLMGEEAGKAIPALVVTAREDPSPAARRGAVHALMRIAIGDSGSSSRAAGFALPVDAAIAGPAPAGKAVPGLPAPPWLAFPLLHPRAEVAAVNLAEVMRIAPDPSVRLYALRALRKVLDVAENERRAAGNRRKPGQPAPKHPASGRWVETVARAIADRVLDPDPEVAGHAVGFLAASRGKDLIPNNDRITVLLAAAEAGGGPLAVELMALNIAATLMNPDHSELPRLFDLAVDRLAAEPPEAAAFSRPDWSEEQRAQAARASYAAIAWRLVDSADDLRDRPEAAELLIEALSGDPEAEHPLQGFGMVRWLYDLNSRMAADEFEQSSRGGSASFHGGFPGLPSVHDSALTAIVSDPRLLGDIWPRVDRRTRLSWLVGDYTLVESMGRGNGSWDRLMPILADAVVVPDLPLERCEAILTQLLDEPEPERDEQEEESLRRLSNEFGRDLRPQITSGTISTGSPPIDPAATGIDPLAMAREVRTLNGLAVMTYFARGATPGGKGIDRLVDRLRGLLGSAQSTTRSWSASLLGSLGRSAESALPELETMVEGESDEAARDAAEMAIEAIRAGDGTGSSATDRGEQE